jgi:tetratricopeptide (TPR) repeat protein
LNLFGSLDATPSPAHDVGRTVQHADAIPALQRLITLGRRRRELHLFSLDPLTADAIHDLLRYSKVNPNAVETLAEWLDEKSAGNPFLLTEIIAQLRTEEILQPVGDGWQLDRARWLRWRTAFTLPETSHDLVGWRLSTLTFDARNLLDVLAVAAQPVSESILRYIPGIWTDSFPSLVDDLVSRGLIMEQPEPAALALPHHLLRETLLHRLSNLRRRAIHQQLAEAIEKHDSLHTSAGQRQIAFHAVAGEDIDRARQYGMSLLPNLPREYIGSETVDFVGHLYDLLTPTASAEEMVSMTRALGTLHQSIGHLEVAAYWHQQTLTWAQKANDYRRRQRLAEKGELALMSNDYDTAMRVAQEGLEIIDAPDVADRSLSTALQLLKGRGYRLLGASLAMEGRDLAAAEDYLQKSVLVLRHYGNRGDLCAALFELGNVAAQRGELGRALDLYGDSARVAEAGKIHYYLALACNNFAYHSLLLGRVEEAQKSAVQGIKVAEDFDLIAALLHLYSTRGEIYLHKTEWEEAEESFQRGLAIAEELDSLERQAGYRGGLALVARGRKDFDKARHLLEEALAMIAERGYWHLRTRLQLWLAETLFDQVHYAEAERILAEAIEIASSQGRTLLVAQGERLSAQLHALRQK